MPPRPATKGSSSHPHRAPLLAGRRTLTMLTAFSVAIFATQIMRIQEPRVNPYRQPTLAEWFLKPHQRNAFLQMPAIGAELNAVFALPGTDLVWVAGSGGLLLRSDDGGQTWEKGRVVVDPVTTIPVGEPAMDTTAADTDLYKGADTAGPTAMAPRTQAGALQAALAWLAPTPLHAQAKQDTTSRTAGASDSTGAGRLGTKGGDASPVQQQVQDPLGASNPAITVLGQTASPDASEGTGEYSAAILSLWFVDDTVGYAGSEAGDVLKTTDGGRTWIASPEFGYYEIISIRFSDTQNGDLIARVRYPPDRSYQATTLGQTPGQGPAEGLLSLYKTSNGGQNWSPRVSVSGADGEISEAEAQAWSADTLFALADTVAEAPSDFQPVFAAGAGGSLTVADVAFTLGDSYGWVVLNGDTSAEVHGRTPGSAWQPLSSTALPRIHRISFVVDRLGWALAESGLVFRTDDGGRRWTQGHMPGQYHLNDLLFTGQHRGWAVGENGTILHTYDGGRRWKLMAGGGDRLHSVSFADARRGWAVGTGGTILRTTNGGRTWKPQRSGTDEALYGVYALSRDTAVAVGADATILRTTDGRRWWSVRPDSALIPSTGSTLNRVWFTPSGPGYAVSDSNSRFWLSTRDRGVSWDTVSETELPREDFAWTMFAAAARRQGATGVRHTSADSAWAVGSGGELLVTGDSGKNWDRADTLARPGLHHITIAPDRRLWAVGEGGTILRRDADGRWHRATAGPLRPAPWYYASWGVVFLLLFVGLRPAKEPPITELVEGTLASDRPIERGEPDPLELGVLAQSVSRFLRNEKTDPPLTLAVTGEWGAGKSSLMNLIRGDLQAWGFRPVWFNAWHHQTEEHLIAAFLENVRAQAIPPLLSLPGLRFRGRLLWMRQRKLILFSLLFAGLFAGYLWADPGRAGAVWKGLVELPKEGAGLAAGLRAVFPDVAAIATLLGVLTVLGRSMQAFGVKPASLLATLSGSARMRDLQAKTSFRHQFAREFEEVTEALRPWDLVVFVDDLDRCRSKQVLDVLEAINFLCTSGRCVIVMGMDMDRVERCVAVQLKDEADAPAPDQAEEEEPAAAGGAPAAKKKPRPDPLRVYARSYLEKLVNIEVPVPQTDVRKAVGLLVPQKEAEEETAEEKMPEEAQQRVERRKRPSRLAAGWEGLRPAFPAARWSLSLAAAIGLGYFLSQPAPEVSRPTPTAGGGAALTQAPTPAATAEPSVTPQSAPDSEETVQPASFFPAPEVQRWDWPLVLGVLLAAGLAAGLVLARPDPTEHDSPRFETALRAWGPYVAAHRRTPRAIKKYLNRVRFCAMRQRVPEPTLPWPERIRQRIAGKSEHPRYVNDSVPDDVLVAIAALDECDPETLEQDATFTRFKAFVRETLGEPDASDPADPRRGLKYDDPLPIAYRDTYRRLASAVRLDGRKG